MVAYHITVTGVVQGVGFRPFVYNLATRLALHGWVLNHSGGVDIEVEGPDADVERFVTALQEEAPPLAHITSVDVLPIPANGYDRDEPSVRFEIRHSEKQEGLYQLISPDVATCPDCLRELFDPQDRRYRYPFINCTNCGPRFTIIDDIPYDRPNTTMRVFPLCDDCRAEYDNPANRRFHAQPNACPVCGPHVWLEENHESRITNHESANQQISKSANQQIQKPKLVVSSLPRVQRGEANPSKIENLTAEAALLRARDLLLDGRILAVKGLGGFHLACDATNADAVRTLRQRKRRPHKPFAVMMATLDDVKAYCEVPPEAEALLASPQAPIVLLDRRSSACPECNEGSAGRRSIVDQRSIVNHRSIVDAVAPNQHTLGVMLPSTPLHHILLRDVGRPLVMTSGNATEEPIAKDNDEALRRLAPLADAFLLHNRDIHARYDDSVMQVRNEKLEMRNGELGMVNDKQPLSNFKFLVSNFQFLRRARGYAPFPIQLPFAMPPTFAAGPLLKNTFTLTRDANAFVSQHIGDMENLETLEHYEAALATFKHLFRIEPEIVACDLHPDYLTTRFADQYAREHGLPEPRRVQHHRAHIAACLADNGRAPGDGPVIGVAFDGTGYGDDVGGAGSIWGGEWFVGDYDGLERVAHLEYLPLPGGDAAIRNPWRIAVAYLHTLLGPEAFPSGIFCPSDALTVRHQVTHRLNTPMTSSMGRLFDAVSALLNVCQTASYEAQAAIELEQIATPVGRIANSPYNFDIENAGDGQVVRIATLFGALLADIERGVPVPEIAARFHATVAQMIVTVCGRIRAATGISTAALSGGVFQNRLLLDRAVPLLMQAGFEVLLHRQVPCNDGGVSLGQAILVNRNA